MQWSSCRFIFGFSLGLLAMATPAWSAQGGRQGAPADVRHSHAHAPLAQPVGRALPHRDRDVARPGRYRSLSEIPLALATESAPWNGPQTQGIQASSTPVPQSVNPINPRTIVTLTPSGSIVLTTPQEVSFYGSGRRHSRRSGLDSRRSALARSPYAYAPPAFHVLGEPSRKHMAATVRLTHGIQSSRRFSTKPKVIFLSETGKNLESKHR